MHEMREIIFAGLNEAVQLAEYDTRDFWNFMRTDMTKWRLARFIRNIFNSWDSSM